ncbi:uncharacterized protein KIAA0040 homolog [Hyla sarda]|uniref:uncharacterized protein KIAA0040 homolog n=1 Tax=Hyla sarda TaxID=327740 RepID=UPI0024C23369|nr:uncharacterized protein KIAA0040 homolog [Hyla sarda]XP_056388077.1 uncharacterized protein KIAA0040 homolog [Hyla sarda]XP_056388078.1 uncharacterized protein KIAA0040 homolog [Hyla sarda]XP_056388079.1 uncharacterized protein KIAA0040 homolog [Hyla sarda]XP_056388080.1 uncharacterized protein KIAA0040 homolog [Hyla sarda]XP_056388081.1 uncharacterized protein KIAA0040 homolog [Hyla sarda]XP_056388082.1 uncharacterized protein KIAA0040 homolog [Hyla sarda]XP_056388083.1 uncharacterized p
MEPVNVFFQRIYEMIKYKHEQGIYNSICLGILLALPFLVLLITSIICCHFCCCRTRKSNTLKPAPSKKKKKKNEEEDLWIPNPQAKTIMLEKVPSFSV